MAVVSSPLHQAMGLQRKAFKSHIKSSCHVSASMPMSFSCQPVQGALRRPAQSNYPGSLPENRGPGTFALFTAAKTPLTINLKSQREIRMCCILQLGDGNFCSFLQNAREQQAGAMDRASLYRSRKHNRLGLRRQLGLVVCSTGDSPGFDISILEREAREVAKLFQTLAPMQAKFYDFDLEGKKIYCAQMEAFLEKLRIFTTRYRLMDNPMAKEHQRSLDIMLLEAGTNPYAHMESMQQAVTMLQEDISRHEKLGPNYQRPKFQGTIFRPEFTLERCMDDPEVAAALNDPLILKAVQDVASDPANMARYADNPRISKFLQKMIDPRWLGRNGS